MPRYKLYKIYVWFRVRNLVCFVAKQKLDDQTKIIYFYDVFKIQQAFKLKILPKHF